MTQTMPSLQSTESGEGIQKHKDYNLKSITLLSAGSETLDLKSVMVELSFFEDIYSHSISGNLLITDALGIIENAQLHGNEYIRISFAKAASDGKSITIDKIFRIYKVSARQKLKNDISEGYIINFCSDEVILSEQYIISKSYPGKTIKEIITDILENHLKVPKDKYDTQNIQDTLGTYSLIVPNFKPFEAIQWLSTYARPADTSSIGSDMLFFENAKDGYVFASMQTLFSQKPFYTFQFSAKNLPRGDFDNDDEYFFNVLSYSYEKSFDVLNGVQMGMFANKLISLDILQHSMTITKFNYNEDTKNSKSLNPNPVVNNLKNRFGDTLYETPDALSRLALTNANQYDNPYIAKNPGSVSQDIFAETFLVKRKSQLAINNYNRLKLVVSGNPTISVGQVVVFNINSNNTTGGDAKNTFYSGKYLISSIRHTIHTSGYNTIIELIKDSNAKPYNSVDNDSQIWKNTVAGVKK